MDKDINIDWDNLVFSQFAGKFWFSFICFLCNSSTDLHSSCLGHEEATAILSSDEHFHVGAPHYL